MRPATGLCLVLRHPLVRFDWHKAGRRLASALSWRCFPVGHHQLQHPPPSADPAVPSSPSNAHVVHAPPPRGGTVCRSISPRKKHIGRAEREILVPVLHRNKSPLHMAFPTTVDPADRALGPLSPLPCHAWHGYRVSNAHHGKVRGCRRACERTPFRGRRRCAAGGRPGISDLVNARIGRVRVHSLSCFWAYRPVLTRHSYRVLISQRFGWSPLVTLTADLLSE
jgi:hypothetical protein